MNNSLKLTEQASFFLTIAVSFVGRPFPLSEANEHFYRLQHWVISFLVNEARDSTFYDSILHGKRLSMKDQESMIWSTLNISLRY